MLTVADAVIAALRAAGFPIDEAATADLRAADLVVIMAADGRRLIIEPKTGTVELKEPKE